MIDQLSGAASALVIVLAYLLILQAMTGAVLLLGQFIVTQARTLAAMVGERPYRSPEPVTAPDDQELPYRLGGGLAKW